MTSTRGKVSRLVEQPVARALAYYALLFAGTALLLQLVPQAGSYFKAGPADLGRTAEDAGLDFTRGPVFAGGEGLPLASVLAMATAFLLMLPVAWIYILTRRKKGFRQSVVQTLLILPIVVAGVVMLVKNSLALAFSLGGIVAAVSFRNTLRDTKDAVYIFLATSVGLAAGVQAAGVAAALSVGFNVAILILWWTDFGRAPAELQGPPAQLRLRRALAQANRTNAFVSMVDREILRSLTPEQLEALADRARRRRAKATYGGAAGPDDGKRPAEWHRLAMRAPTDVAAARAAVETLLDASVKRWEFVAATPSTRGGTTLEYRVRLKRSLPGERLVENLHSAVAPHVTDAEVR